MSPILVRPVREQFEHDRVIRLLQAKFRRRFDVGINPGSEQNVPIGSGASAVYPDVVLTSGERGRRVHAVVEVETAESVNNLEALAQWAHLARLRPAFHLYVPVGSVDSAKRLCVDNNIPVAEIQGFHSIGDQIRFMLVYRAHPEGRAAARKQAPPPHRATRSKPSKPKRARAGGAPRRPVKPRKTSRPQKRR